MSFIGVNIGALSVKIAALRDRGVTGVVVAHQGRPIEVLGQFLASSQIAGAEFFIAERRLPDFFVLNPAAENNYLGFDQGTLARHVTPAILIADLLVEIDYVLRVAGAPGTIERCQEEWPRFAAGADTLDAFNARLPALADRFAALPCIRDPQVCPHVVITGCGKALASISAQ